MGHACTNFVFARSLTTESVFPLSDAVGRKGTARHRNSKEDEELVVGKTWLDPRICHVDPSFHLSQTGLHRWIGANLAIYRRVEHLDKQSHMNDCGN